jgi:hypothetical protein
MTNDASATTASRVTPLFRQQASTARLLLYLCLSIGAIVSMNLASANPASADVDMRARLKLIQPRLKHGAHGNATAANGDYKCLDKYSSVANWDYYFSIGTCKEGEEIEVVSYANENSQTHEHSYGGFVNGSFQGCGWIDTRYPLEKKNSNQNTKCPEGAGNEFKVEESTFWEKRNSGAEDGYYVVNKTACPEYANYRPWSSSNVEKEKIHEAAAYAEGPNGGGEPALKWRYVTKYSSTDGSGKYVMVRDVRYGTGEGNWVFVPRSCLPSTLPEGNSERVPSKPVVSTTAASGIATPNATLNGTVNPEGTATTYYFQYGTTENWNESATAHVELGSGTTTLTESVPVSGLKAGTTYYFRIVATSAVGTSTGGPQAFTTQPPPTAVTEAATGVAETLAIANGSVNPEGLDTHYHFEYGPTTSYGTSTSEIDAGAGTTAIHEAATLEHLEPGTTYHYRLVASSSAGTGYGSDYTVSTRSRPTVVVTANKNIQVFYRAEDGEVLDDEWVASTNTWHLYGTAVPAGDAVGNPSAVLTSNGNIQVLVRLTDGEIALDQWSASKNTWGLYPTAVPAGEAVGNPATIVSSNGNIQVLVRLLDGEIAEDQYSASQNEWALYATAVPAGEGAGDPSAVLTSNGNIQVLVRLTDGEIALDQWSASKNTWGLYPTAAPAGSAVGSPTAVVTSDGNIQVFYSATGGGIPLDQWNASNNVWTQYETAN